MRAVCFGTGGTGCWGWSDMAEPPQGSAAAPTPLSPIRLNPFANSIRIVCEKACWLVSEPPSSGLVENRSLKGVLDMAKGKKSSQKAIPLVEERIPLVEERVSVTKRTI